MAIKVTHGFALLLHQKEGWQTATSPGLSQTQRDDNQEPLPTSPHLRANGQIARRQVLFQTRRLMGLQQCMHQDWQ